MIENDHQLEVTKAALKEIENGILLTQAHLDGMKSQRDDLKLEIIEYEVKTGQRLPLSFDKQDLIAMYEGRWNRSS